MNNANVDRIVNLKHRLNKAKAVSKSRIPLVLVAVEDLEWLLADRTEIYKKGRIDALHDAAGEAFMRTPMQNWKSPKFVARWLKAIANGESDESWPLS